MSHGPTVVVHLVQTKRHGVAGFAMSLVGFLTCGCMSQHVTDELAKKKAQVEAPAMPIVETSRPSEATPDAKGQAPLPETVPLIILERTAPEDTPPPKVVKLDRPQKTEFRTFRNNSGRLEVRARFNGLKDGKVMLLREDGTTLEIPLDRLHSSDRAWIARQPKQ